MTVAIREDKGRIFMTGLHQVDINSVDDLLSALNFGSSIRQTDSTAINAKSSRSHAVFSINLVQRKNKAAPSAREKRLSMPVEAMSGAEDWVTVDSKLHFVDLAGSERLKNTGASGDRAKEGISINAGLASLGKVISQLSTRQAGTHISYRDSKLTRLLQDSLGGNAITYMIACVTPAEFHLSETLNTVQYAQRARAIQSKPQIQQTSDEADKQAVIDRLRAEVSFLRDQIRNSERGMSAPQERAERQNEREIELQNHLLDVQENYSALSQRHAKLISEITKARDDESSETPTLTEAIGDSAVERLKRSNSFAEAVEQVVLEYEKTIQSLETSLSNTRSSLATTESTLLEKENRCAYVETVNQQLQNRVQKLMDRDSENEAYLHNLEAKLDGQSTGDEKSAALVLELRKEIARIRASEAQCEDYISTLEERLAEADQDMELKQRELDRLEHVVERQRSLGKLDSLLYEFDHLQQNGKPEDAPVVSKTLTNGVPKSKKNSKLQPPSWSTLQEAANTAIPESDDEDDTILAPQATSGPTEDQEEIIDQRDVSTARASPAAVAGAIEQHSPEQSKVVADKLEDVTQELFDLRIQHESTISEFDMLNAKYHEALRTLAELQDAVDEARHPAEAGSIVSPASTRPTSFLEDARVNELKDGGQLPSSRSLSSELSSARDSNTSLDPSSVDESPHKKVPSGDWRRMSHREESLLQEIEDLRRTNTEKEEALRSSDGRYSELQELHADTLDIIEELKTEVQKARHRSPTSPTSPVIRRKSSQNVMTIDRAHRSLASLRNIAAENLEDKPDTMQSFEINLNTAMHELHQRSERVQLLESELATLKKEMEAKATMISGLTRERSSLKTSAPMDMSVVSTLHGQLLQNENQMRMLQEQHASREQELLSEVESLKQSLEHAESAKAAMPGFFPETPATSTESNKQLGDSMASPQEVQRLQEEVSQWQQKHNTTVESMQVSEKRLRSTISELESSLASVEAMRRRSDEKARESEGISATAADLQNEKANHVQTISALSREIDGHKATIGSHMGRIARLEQLQATAREQLEEAAHFRSNNESQLEAQRQQISELEQQIEERESAVQFHKHGLKSLHDSHAREVDSLRSTINDHAQARADLEHKLEEMQGVYASQIGRLETEVIDLKDQLERAKAGLTEELRQSKAACDAMQKQRDHLQQQVQSLKEEIAAAVKSNEASMAEIEKIKAEKDRATNLVDELEEQLSVSYDQQQASNSRLSVLSNSQSQIPQVNATLTALEKQLEASQNQVEQLQVRQPRPFHVDEVLTKYRHKCATHSKSIEIHQQPLTHVRVLLSPHYHLPHPPFRYPHSHLGPLSHLLLRLLSRENHSPHRLAIQTPNSLRAMPLNSKRRTITSVKWKSISSLRSSLLQPSKKPLSILRPRATKSSWTWRLGKRSAGPTRANSKSCGRRGVVQGIACKQWKRKEIRDVKRRGRRHSWRRE